MILSRRVGAIVVAGAAAIATQACSNDSAGRTGDVEDQPYIVATTTIWADVTQMVVCDGSLAVRTLIPPGGDAHAYEPSLRDRETLDNAALIIANGAGLEELLDDTLDDVEAGGVPVVRVAELTEHEAGDTNPHVWFDPTRVRAALPALGEAVTAGGADGPAIDGCVAAAEVALDELDAEIRAIVAAIPPERRLLVTNHDSLGPFADRYGFEILGTVLGSSSTLTEPSPGDLEALGQAIEATGTPAIFTEALHGSTDAEALGARLGIEVVELHTGSLGEPGSGAETYPELLRTDAELIAAALAP